MSHEVVEKNVGLMMILIVIVISFGGLVEIVPLFFIKDTTEPVLITKADGTQEYAKPYSALRLEGRDVYIREGCYNCHSQMIRPFRSETERYGPYSVAGESVYDRPFQWGSKRTGPDVARVGGKYSNDWHVAHLINPRAVVPESIMPGYPFLAERPLSAGKIAAELKTLRVVGVPYTDDQIENALADLQAQANPEMGDGDAVMARYPKAVLGDFDGNPSQLTEMDALVAYLQMMGTLVDTTSYQTSPDGR